MHWRIYTSLKCLCIPADVIVMWLWDYRRHWFQKPNGHSTQQSRHCDVKTTSQRRFDVIMMLLLRRVSAGKGFCLLGTKPAPKHAMHCGTDDSEHNKLNTNINETKLYIFFHPFSATFPITWIVSPCLAVVETACSSASTWALFTSYPSRLSIITTPIMGRSRSPCSISGSRRTSRLGIYTMTSWHISGSIS